MGIEEIKQSLVNAKSIPWRRSLIDGKPPEAELDPREPPSDEERGINTAAYKSARALLELAKKKNAQWQSTFTRDWQFLLGENHFQIPKNSLALRNAEYKNQTVRNWTFSTCDQKAALLMEGKVKITASPFAGPVSFTDRWRAQEILLAEAERVRATEYWEDALWDGMAVGKGLTRFIRRVDERSGMKFIELEDMDPGCWFPDPTASRLHQAKHGHYEIWMDAAEIRKTWPKKHHLVKMTERSVGGDTSDILARTGRSRTDAEIVQSPGKEFAVTKEGQVSEKGAKIAFSWIVDEEVVEEIEEREQLGTNEGYQCASCMALFEADPNLPDLNSLMAPEMEDAEIPPAVSCPECGSEAVMAVTIPTGVETGDEVRRFRYPFGRLTCTSKDALLYDGPNPDEIDTVFPVAEYPHYRVNRRYWGYGEVAHLKSAQIAADKTMTQLLDYIRTAVNGVLEYPEDAVQYKDLGNAPNPRIGLAPQLIGQARYLPPPPLQIQAFQYIDELILRDFQRQSGLTDITSGLTPSAPTSGDEVEARVSAGTVRMGGHRRRWNQYRSDFFNILWQMAWQNYREPRMFPVSDSKGRVAMIQIEMQKLPRNMKMYVTSDPEDVKKSELTIQAMQQLMVTQQIPPMLDLLLPLTGMSQSDADIMMSRIELAKEEEAAAASMMPPGPPAGIGGEAGPEPGPPSAPPLPPPASDQARPL